jgi:hypothetical protein
MTRLLTRDDYEYDDDADARYIQFRGRQTVVSVEGVPVIFECEQASGFDGRRHKPLPVVPDDPDPDADIPSDAVAESVAEALCENNPVICWGVVCEYPTGDDDNEVCGEVLKSPSSVENHAAQKHNGDDASDESTTTDGDNR